MIMIMIKRPVKAQPIYRISTKYYCIINNNTCSETNNQVSLSLSVSFVGHINNQDLLLLDGNCLHYISQSITFSEPLLDFCFSVSCLWDLDLVTILSPQMIISVSPLTLQDFSCSTNKLCLVCSALVMSVDMNISSYGFVWRKIRL